MRILLISYLLLVATYLFYALATLPGQQLSFHFLSSVEETVFSESADIRTFPKLHQKTPLPYSVVIVGGGGGGSSR
jgi:hypothetical protein